MSTVENKTCPKCGKSFECLHNAECWCMDYKISPENLERLKKEYDDCLCPECLKAYTQDVRPKRCG